MSWGLASMLGLGAVLAIGFAWYERTRPSARLLAVVGTLAALAILGRVAFAPIPNVKPTTDIVLIAGYALGGAPGFAVGAVAALGSDLFFGEGPWTPWQMAAWGLVGVFGAALARGSGGRMGRVPLAVACGIAGFAYGAILDASVWVTFGGEHTLGQYLAISGRGLPFNVAHAVGNVVFFAAFGPGLIRAVRRCQARFEIDWRAAGAAVPLLLATVVAAGALHGAPASAAGSPAGRALAYLQQARNADGGWGPAPRTASDSLRTTWATYAVAAAGVRPGALTRRVLLTQLGRSRRLDDVERTILALRASGGDPRHAGGRDLVAELLAKQGRDGSFGGYVSFTSYAVLALRAAGETHGVAPAARWIARQADADGGFNLFRRGGASDPDDTAGAIEALAAASSRSTPTVRRAASFLRTAQKHDGGYSLTPGTPSNAQSTAFAALGLTAARLEPKTVTRALTYLRAHQAKDGSIRYSSFGYQTPVWVTAQALLALERRPLPVLATRDRGDRGANAQAGGGRPRVRQALSARSRRRRAGLPDARTHRPRTTAHRAEIAGPELATLAGASGIALALLLNGLLRA